MHNSPMNRIASIHLKKRCFVKMLGLQGHHSPGRSQAKAKWGREDLLPGHAIAHPKNDACHNGWGIRGDLFGLIIVVLLWMASVNPAMAMDAMALNDSPYNQAAEIRAQLTPRHQALLSAGLSATIQRLTVREGDRFPKGHVLVKFDCAVHTAELKKAQALLDAAHKKLEVNQRLSELNSIREMDVELAKMEVAKSKAEVEIRQATVKRCIIKAPFAGGVSERMAKSHEYLKAGSPLMEIINDRDLEMELIVPSKWLSWLKKGLLFHVNMDETQKKYPAKVSRLGIQVDPVSQSVKVIGRVSGVFPELKPGMSGHVIFPPRPSPMHR